MATRLKKGYRVRLEGFAPFRGETRHIAGVEYRLGERQEGAQVVPELRQEQEQEQGRRSAWPWYMLYRVEVSQEGERHYIPVRIISRGFIPRVRAYAKEHKRGFALFPAFRGDFVDLSGMGVSGAIPTTLEAHEYINEVIEHWYRDYVKFELRSMERRSSRPIPAVDVIIVKEGERSDEELKRRAPSWHERLNLRALERSKKGHEHEVEELKAVIGVVVVRYMHVVRAIKGRYFLPDHMRDYSKPYCMDIFHAFAPAMRRAVYTSINAYYRILRQGGYPIKASKEDDTIGMIYASDSDEALSSGRAMGQFISSVEYIANETLINETSGALLQAWANRYANKCKSRLQTRIIKLFIYEGISEPRIAERLDCSVNTVYKYVRELLQAFKESGMRRSLERALSGSTSEVQEILRQYNLHEPSNEELSLGDFERALKENRGNAGERAQERRVWGSSWLDHIAL